MKKMIGALGIIVLMTSAATAQKDSTHHKMQHPPMDMRGKGGEGFKPKGPGHFKGDMDKRMGGKFGDRKGMMMQHLNLTEEQRKQGKTIHENTQQQLAALEKNDKMTLGDYKKKKAAILKDQKDKMQALLTDEQKTKIADGKKKMQENMQVRGAARLERMKIDLGLKDEQVATIKASQTQLHEKVKAIHENDALLPEQKKEQVKALMNQQKESLKSVLTVDQLAKLESMKKHEPRERDARK